MNNQSSYETVRKLKELIRSGARYRATREDLDKQGAGEGKTGPPAASDRLRILHVSKSEQSRKVRFDLIKQSL